MGCCGWLVKASEARRLRPGRGSSGAAPPLASEGGSAHGAASVRKKISPKPSPAPRSCPLVAEGLGMFPRCLPRGFVSRLCSNPSCRLPPAWSSVAGPACGGHESWRREGREGMGAWLLLGLFFLRQKNRKTRSQGERCGSAASRGVLVQC